MIKYWHYDDPIKYLILLKDRNPLTISCILHILFIYQKLTEAFTILQSLEEAKNERIALRMKEPIHNIHLALFRPPDRERPPPGGPLLLRNLVI